MKLKTTFSALLAAAGLVVSVNGQLTISSLPQTISEDFNGLISTDGDSATFTDNSTISGWYVNSEEMDSNSDEYFAEDGTSAGGEVFSFGDDGDSDRALGYTGSGGNDYFNVAVRLENDTGITIEKIEVSYVGEQWRSGGDSSDNNNLLEFSYQTFTSGSGSLPASTSLTGWTEVNSLDFTPPQTSVSAGNLDGNLSANQTSFSNITISSLSWADGDELWLRWTGDNGSGSDAGIGIDDFSVSAIPEPSTYGAIGGILALVMVLYRRRKQAAAQEC